MTLREHLLDSKVYKYLQKELSKSKRTNQDWEDNFHDFLVYNLETTYKDRQDILQSIRDYKAKNKKLVEVTLASWKIEKSIELSSLFEDSRFTNSKVCILNFIRSLNSKQLHFYYKELVILYLTSKDDFKTTAHKANLSESTFRYKVQKAIEIVFAYIFKIKLNIKQFKIMSVQKIKPGKERLATLIINAEKGYPFNSSEFMRLYVEATQDTETKFQYNSKVVKSLIEKAKPFVFESEVAPVEVLEEVLETILDVEEIKVPELESHNLENDADIVLNSGKDRKSKKK